MRLAGRTAIVTGSASGIGRAIALRFSREGAHVIVADLSDGESSSRDGTPATADAIATEGGKATFVRTDVTIAGSVETLFKSAQRIANRIDVVVSNAGIFRGYPVVATEPASWDADMDLNLRSHYLVNRMAVSLMLDQPAADGVRGRIINMASQLGVTAPPGHLTYAVAKAGVAHMTRQLAVDYGPRGILINALAPGRIITGYHPGEADYVDKGAVDAATAYSLQRTPFWRLGKPDDVAGPALFLASDDCSFVSGHVLMVDGGWTAF